MVNTDPLLGLNHIHLLATRLNVLRVDTDPLLMLDSAPRKDVDIGFTLDWTVADDFGPSRFEPTKEEPAVSLLLRAVDIDVDKYEDPHTKERTIERPMNAAQVTFTRDRIVVATMVQTEIAEDWISLAVVDDRRSSTSSQASDGHGVFKAHSHRVAG